MAEWKTIRRETGLIEHVCEHGIGHPNVGSMARLDEIYGPGSDGSWGVHGCDGCCSGENFPGNALNTIKFTYGEYASRPEVAASIMRHDAVLWGFVSLIGLESRMSSYAFYDLFDFWCQEPESNRIDIRKKFPFLYFTLMGLEKYSGLGDVDEDYDEEILYGDGWE